MTYKTRCNSNCVDRIDRQAETIHKLRDENLMKTQSLVQANEKIERLEAEKLELTQALNKVSDRNRTLEVKYIEKALANTKGRGWF